MPCVMFGMSVMEVPIALLMMIGFLAYPLLMDMIDVSYSIVMPDVLLEKSYNRLQELDAWETSLF